MDHGILTLPPLGESSTPEPRQIELGRMEVLGRFGPFHGVLPPDWTPYHEHSRWEVGDGHLYGRASNNNPAILRWEPQIEGNHAIRFLGAAIKHEGETDADVAANGNLNCFFDYTGDFGAKTPYAMTCAGIAGWYAGMTGIELLSSHAGVPVRAVSRPFELQPDRIYDVFAGRFDDTKFVFVDGRLAMAVEVTPAALGTTADAMRPLRSRVALGTWGRHGGSTVRIDAIEVYHLPNATVAVAPRRD